MSPADTRDPVPLLATTYGQCRFIVAEWPQPLCGGAPSAAGHSWCSMHRQVVYVPTRTKERTAST